MVAEQTGQANTRFTTPFGDFSLARYPARRRERLNAWCSADLLLLEEAARLGVSGENMLVVNDAYGALAIPARASASWTDSWLSAEALRRNDPAGRTRLLWATQAPPSAPVILLRVPKQLSYLEYQLQQLAVCMPADGLLLAAGMDKHLSPHTANAFETIIGPTQRHRGRKKARLFSVRRDPGLAPSPPAATQSYVCDVLEETLSSRPNVFSGGALDGGSRLLLRYLPGLDKVANCIDLACGNGVLGLAALQLGIARRVAFCDESALAIASARDNAARLFPERMAEDCSADIRFHHNDGVAGLAADSAELILCNPPFHSDHTVDDFVGRRLLEQCGAVLHSGGRLLLVANRHLNYRGALQHQFRRVEQVASDARFNLLLAHKA